MKIVIRRKDVIHFLILILIVLCDVALVLCQDLWIDHRYTPEYWYSAIGFPGDYHKTLVDENGSLLYDFGPGPYVRPNTVISVGLKDEPLTLTKQYYDDARIPVVCTELASETGSIAIKSYSLIPETFEEDKSKNERIWRTNGLTGSQSWASPPDSADPAFRHVAWGTNRPIEYHIGVNRGESRTVVLGFCESYRTKTGLRTLDLHIEGAQVRTIDPLDAGPANTPQIYRFNARDENNDAVIDVEVLSPKGDPNTILNVLWVFPADYELDENALIRGEMSDQAEIYLDAGREPQVINRAPRFDVLKADFSGGSVPSLNIQTKRRLEYDRDAGVVFADDVVFIKTSAEPEKINKTDEGLELIFKAGTDRVTALVQNGFDSNPAVFARLDSPDIDKKMEQYWLKDVAIPYDRIVVPDQELQNILTSSIRTFYQSNEIVDGYPQFQPGVALYRGLWMHDGVYFAELALQLGDWDMARAVVEGYLRYQHESGQVEVMRPNNLHRETPLLLWLLCRYAELTGDDAWMQKRWQHVEKGVAWIRYLRELTLKAGAPNYGLTPAGFADGGVHGVQPEYASVNWILIALPKAIDFALRYGKQDQADSWQKLYEQFLSSFKAAMQRDIMQDEYGNSFLPVRVGAGTNDDVPQRGQWTLTEALMHGSYIKPDNPLVQGTIAMLEAHSAQGLVTSVGWLTDGIWVYYGGFLAEAYLKCSAGDKAAAMLYAMANHASPVATWPEEQMPTGKGRRTVGDYPHTWASSTMVRLVIRLLALEDGDDFILFRGLPAEWLQAGSRTELNGVATRFGSVNLKLHISEDGKQAQVSLQPLSATGTGKIFLDERAFKAAGFMERSHEKKPGWGEPFDLVLIKK